MYEKISSNKVDKMFEKNNCFLSFNKKKKNRLKLYFIIIDF